MRLIVGTMTLSVAQVGPDFIILRAPIHLSPARAELVVEIDGAEERTAIFLPDGVRATDEQTRIALI